MKKALFAMAVAGMFGFAACNNNNATEESAPVDSVTVETVEAAAAATEEENLVKEVTNDVVEAVMEDLTK
ncbi:MAG: hypothetical protein IKP83_03205 [Bacteroidales bacterium]|nr:hypothetical protein [Bacteroidales bacterium]